jgi:hypothetical protein
MIKCLICLMLSGGPSYLFVDMQTIEPSIPSSIYFILGLGKACEARPRMIHAKA